jgi:L-ascorbate metabolism protein UlaG (beta-lactamase superfamily)
VLIDRDGVRLLTDPVLRPLVAHLRRHGRTPKPPRGVEAVLISHLHHDHLNLASLRELPGRPRVIVPRGAGAWLARLGIDADELAAGESIEVRGVEIRAVPAEHDATRRPGGPFAEPIGFMIGTSPSVYFAGDTDVFDAMSDFAPVDVALLPVAGWGPRLGPGHMNAERAASAARLLQPRIAIPIHWGTFHPAYARLGAWFTEPPHDFADHVAAVAPSVDARVLTPGESTSVSA